CFYVFYHHRYLHSFPTRRSSDLANGLGMSFLSEFSIKNHQLIKEGKVIPVPLVNYERSNLTCGYIRSKKRSTSSLATELVKIIRDRKSTRLNSSHVSISYADFCL